MTDSTTRAQAAMLRVSQAEPSSFVNRCTVEIAQEIEQAIQVERKRCAAIVRGYYPNMVLMSLEETKRMIENIATDIEEGLDYAGDPYL